MKNYNKFLVALALGAFVSSCAEQDIENFYVEKPESVAAQEPLLAYGNIKDYVDRAAYPNFKIACALGADDYNAKGIVYRVGNANFDEITLGNAMKYASVVADDGTMDFSKITELLENAEVAGMSVYGHTLAWHAQQNTKFLNSCIADLKIPQDRIEDYVVNFGEWDEYPFTGSTNTTFTIHDGYLTADAKARGKFYLAQDVPTVPGETYEVLINVRSQNSTAMRLCWGVNKYTDGNAACAPATVGKEWNEVKVSFKATTANSYLLVDLGPSKGTFDIEYVNIGHYTPDSRPLTDKEKVDTLTAEMNRWIDGMMAACEVRVKAWDLINEAVSGEDRDGDGFYDLQTAATGGASDFFWQDYLTPEMYGPIVSKAARTAYAAHGGNPADLKLFINDYNLESDWDNNKKLKSMINWIKIWEKNGATIDGVSSQMHISYYENEGTMRSKAKHMVNMLKLMAETGKLVRISELDMGYVDINGVDLKPEEMNAAQKQNMANYYQFIIQMFLKIVPPAQQYSICQWCLTDANSKSGWRANSPVGLWDLDWNRKPAYAGYCEAFIRQLPSTDDYFEFLSANGYTHYISTAE